MVSTRRKRGGSTSGGGAGSDKADTSTEEVAVGAGGTEEEKEALPVGSFGTIAKDVARCLRFRGLGAGVLGGGEAFGSSVRDLITATFGLKAEQVDGVRKILVDAEELALVSFSARVPRNRAFTQKVPAASCLPHLLKLGAVEGEAGGAGEAGGGDGGGPGDGSHRPAPRHRLRPADARGRGRPRCGDEDRRARARARASACRARAQGGTGCRFDWTSNSLLCLQMRSSAEVKSEAEPAAESKSEPAVNGQKEAEANGEKVTKSILSF